MTDYMKECSTRGNFEQSIFPSLAILSQIQIILYLFENYEISLDVLVQNNFVQQLNMAKIKEQLKYKIATDTATTQGFLNCFCIKFWRDICDAVEMTEILLNDYIKKLSSLEESTPLDASRIIHILLILSQLQSDFSNDEKEKQVTKSYSNLNNILNKYLEHLNNTFENRQCADYLWSYYYNLASDSYYDKIDISHLNDDVIYQLCEISMRGSRFGYFYEVFVINKQRQNELVATTVDEYRNTFELAFAANYTNLAPLPDSVHEKYFKCVINYPRNDKIIFMGDYWGHSGQIFIYSINENSYKVIPDEDGYGALDDTNSKDNVRGKLRPAGHWLFVNNTNANPPKEIITIGDNHAGLFNYETEKMKTLKVEYECENSSKMKSVFINSVGYRYCMVHGSSLVSYIATNI